MTRFAFCSFFVIVDFQIFIRFLINVVSILFTSITDETLTVSTIYTLIKLVSSSSAPFEQVMLQFILSCKALITVRAGMRFFSSVQQFVSYHVLGTGKLFPADVTRMLVVSLRTKKGQGFYGTNDGKQQTCEFSCVGSTCSSFRILCHIECKGKRAELYSETEGWRAVGICAATTIPQ